MDDNAVEGLVGERSEFVFAFSQRLFCSFALGDVLDLHEISRWRFVFVRAQRSNDHIGLNDP